MEREERRGKRGEGGGRERRGRREGVEREGGRRETINSCKVFIKVMKHLKYNICSIACKEHSDNS